MNPVITGGAESIPQGTSVTLTGSAPGEQGEINYRWYLDGKMMQQSGNNYAIPADLNTGPHRVDLIIYNADYTRSGSATSSFTIVNQ
jgi:hypothetical protein